jgi:hypothetical protein
MTIRISTGLRNAVLGEYGVSAMMNLGVIEVYTGVQPFAPDEPPSGTLVAIVTNNGDSFVPGGAVGALSLKEVTTGALEKSGTWRLKGVNVGVAGWWRWMWNATDTRESSQYFPRMDGMVGESLILQYPDITATTDIEVESFTLSIGE